VIRDVHNIIPVTMAGLLHAGFVASMLFVFDFGPSPVRAQPTLVFETEMVTMEDLEVTTPPPAIREPEPEPLPEPDPIPPEPEVDTARLEAEEKMRKEEEAKENIRIAAEKEAERKRVAAEKKRLAEVERQRQENMREKREAEEMAVAVASAEAMRNEQQRLDAQNSDAMRRYVFALQSTIQRNFIRPASAVSGIECVINVRQLPGGDVVSVKIGVCNGNDAVRRAIEAAVKKSSPLPQPENQILFARDLRITFKPEE
jgi:colicin import membrane protein